MQKLPVEKQLCCPYCGEKKSVEDSGCCDETSAHFVYEENDDEGDAA
ncbi:MAG: hypothetical protein ACXWQO_07945 [Bdellovibrionota bacterium]